MALRNRALTSSQVTVSRSFPALLRLFESPPYTALISTVPAAFPVTVSEQLPDTSVHVVDEKVTVPVPETSDHVTIPVCVGYPPDTVAVHVIDAGAEMEDAVHDIVVAVGALVIVSEAFPELPESLESPL